MTSLNISIGDDLRAFLEDQARKHGFSTEGEYVEAVLREAQERETAHPESAESNGRARFASPWEIAAAISASVPDEEWAKVPPDLSKNVDHYLYGVQQED